MRIPTRRARSLFDKRYNSFSSEQLKPPAAAAKRGTKATRKPQELHGNHYKQIP
ncbi:hypothetical protein CCACVL1_25606 [Corchorus capsularis]|uniref:Uncharacterized protein n=1 Tax=Corchorus capsularis TaxID=210143 RepID=A0A1R3GIY0_COCAP|nr:hypothetical protein CCACVL1_25606 [Corchorus capsularis]